MCKQKRNNVWTKYKPQRNITPWTSPSSHFLRVPLHISVPEKSMGRCESGCVSLGLRIPIQKLLMRVTENNFRQILKMLQADEGWLEDENDCWNESYDRVRDQLHGAAYESAEAFTAGVTALLQKHGNVHYLRDGSREHTLEEGTLLAQTLLLPTVTVVETSRWGYNREGCNGASVPIGDFDFAAHAEKIRQDYSFLGVDGGEVVLMVCQRGY
jgi:hypothetical protein